MSDELPASRLAQLLGPWVPIAGGICTVMSFLILLGMWLGPQKDIPATLTTIMAKLNQIEGRMDKTDWAVEALKNQSNALGMQLSVAVEDRNKLWDALRELKSLATRLEDSSVSREMFLEWKSDFEARMRTSTPPLIKSK